MKTLGQFAAENYRVDPLLLERAGVPLDGQLRMLERLHTLGDPRDKILYVLFIEKITLITLIMLCMCVSIYIYACPSLSLYPCPLSLVFCSFLCACVNLGITMARMTLNTPLGYTLWVVRLCVCVCMAWQNPAGNWGCFGLFTRRSNRSMLLLYSGAAIV